MLREIRLVVGKIQPHARRRHARDAAARLVALADVPDIALLPFKNQPPHRRIAMVWRRSSAMDAFLQQLADAFRQVPAALLQPPRAA